MSFSKELLFFASSFNCAKIGATEVDIGFRLSSEKRSRAFRRGSIFTRPPTPPPSQVGVKKANYNFFGFIFFECFG